MDKDDAIRSGESEEMKALEGCASAQPLSCRGRFSLFPRVPLAVPYWNGETYRAILRSLSSGGTIDGPDLWELRTLLTEILDVPYAVLCGSGSLALELALQGCGVGRGNEVIVPSFCCTAVIPPILAVGALPVLADVDDNLNANAAAIESVLSEKTRAIVVPHLFGNPVEIAPILGLVRGRNIRVIDDAAQALGASIADQPVGSFGDVGILSFGSEKVCFGLGGGAVISRHKEIIDHVSEIVLPPPSNLNSLQRLFSTLVWHRWRRWTLPLHSTLARGKAGSPDAPPQEYRKETMANLNAAVALSLVRRLRENINARRARVCAYRELLGSERRLTLLPHEPGSTCLTQVVRVLSRRRDRDLSTDLIEVLSREGYEVQGSYVPIHLIPRYESYARGFYPNTERVWPDLIELPCEPDVSLDDLEKIAAILKQALKSA